MGRQSVIHLEESIDGLDFLVEPQLVCIFRVIDEEGLIHDANADTVASDAT